MQNDKARRILRILKESLWQVVSITQECVRFSGRLRSGLAPVSTRKWSFWKLANRSFNDDEVAHCRWKGSLVRARK